MLDFKVTISPPSGLAHSVARAAAQKTLGAIHQFYLRRQADIPIKKGRLRDSLTQMGAADNIAEVVDGPRGPMARYGTRVDYARWPNVKRKIPKLLPSDLTPSAQGR